jgi:hypothetical protein
MSKYFYLQWKRFLRLLPGALCVVLLLLGGLTSAFSLLGQQRSNDENNQKVRLALCGNAESNFQDMGLNILESFDSTRFAIEILQMEEQEAAKALAKGTVAAYVVFPENFIAEALHGNILPLRLVSAGDEAGIVSVFKEEITKMVSTLLLDAQKGVFGLIKSFQPEGVAYQQDLVNRLAAQYVEFVFARSNTYRTQQISVTGALQLGEYLICGLSVLFVLLSCLPFTALLIRQNEMLALMLRSKGKSAPAQVLCDFAAWLLTLLSLLLAIGICAAIALRLFLPELAPQPDLWEISWRLLPVAIMAAAFSFFLCSLAGDLVSGVLVHFLGVIALCFVSGCMYPVTFFPERVRSFVAWLPTGIAQAQLSTCFTGRSSQAYTLWLLIYSVAFVAAGTLVRCRGMRSSRR